MSRSQTRGRVRGLQQGPAGPAALAAALLAILGLGCATRMEVRSVPDADLADYPTWSWAESSGPSVRPRALDRPLARTLAAELEGRGVEQIEDGASLQVGYAMVVDRRYVDVNETPAESFLPSFSHAKSYNVQATRTQRIVMEYANLVVILANAQGEVIWHGHLRKRVRGDFAPHLDEAVRALLKRLVPPAP